jgi:hypothetical protein
MPRFLSNHLSFEGRTEVLPYISILRGSQDPIRSGLNRKAHGNRIKDEFNAAIESSPQEADYVSVVFISAWDFLLQLSTLNDSKENFRLASYRKIEAEDENGGEHFRIEAVVWLNKNAISKFLKKIDQYVKGKTKKGNIPNQPLIANIEQIKVATLESFWQEPELPFPSIEDVVWWEVWLSRNNGQSTEDIRANLATLFENKEVQVGQRQLLFPEHHVILLRSSARTLSTTLLYSDQLSELRKPRDLADFFIRLDRQEQLSWINDLKARVADKSNDHHISICLLDTGVNRANPLLEDLIEPYHLDTVEPAWSTADTNFYGHGTPMAGLTFYGDLTDVLGSNEQIEIFHHLESIKIVEAGQPNRPELYGHITQEGVARGVIIHPQNMRVVCMAVTSEDQNHKGRPTSWSSAVDQIVFNSISPESSNTLFFVSSGNLSPTDLINSPLINDDCSIDDPAQAFNAITVGAYTLKDVVDQQTYPGVQLLAARGGMAPCNRTSVGWEKEWCRKPDIVMEGGNVGIWNGGIFDHDNLLLLSTGKGGVGRSWLTQFGDTSAATALASKFAVELWSYYPIFWQETIRGLIIHTAHWTSTMLGRRNIHQLSSDQKKKLISRVGYGVPNMAKAKYSANNSLTLIAERTIRPYKLDGSTVKTNEFHFFDLPWPIEALQEIFNTPVTLTVTLSYFVEPNPGAKQYQQAASYRSAGLRFKMKDRNESADGFKARISKALRDEDYQKEGEEDWILGSAVRDKGSIHKDIWIGPAVELAAKNQIAVYPVNGWWRTRKKHGRYDQTLRYSLIITIEGPDAEIDIYNPVLNQIRIPVEV